ncbi:maleate cis-trans isomerase family protein [Aetokthonos hydrillicola]|nr:hypothetical protein [Aetokthonos hydrillicola]MBO3463924.1 hypothetical protein [Aetokthonos hydrillicola CCALA 1050]MBW4588960.1 hypothetical protein [Aetokthonos hydrillicola CCALA 1050]
MSRIHIRDQDLSSNEKMMHLLKQVDEEIFFAIDRVMTAGIDYLIMGISAESFSGGIEGNRAFVRRLEDYTNLKVATGASAFKAALEAFKVNKIAVITPYQPVVNEMVCRFFSDIGVEVVRLKGLLCPTAISIAEITEDALRTHLLELDGDDVDCIVQSGTCKKLQTRTLQTANKAVG